ncbi:TfoX/Sxy family DNA transformation protein [Ideonella sp. 4Y11]|uniref:TfoX/Sxy family DNA transformation protein n=1 Tax=Ideonella aquatica TaxID=2824119 RepID=A0A941BM17_9BURK|nr:TfoX/Sxy family DNA transformation protein [Ideonella aquatica]MBQ0961962.1 TfoX/Sxy family DNA transformation protein [Ideonella aquatica]
MATSRAAPRRPAAAPSKPKPMLRDVANLGPKSEAVLRRVGISTMGQLREFGSVAVYCRAKALEPSVSLNLLLALEGALLGVSWQEVAKVHRTRLLLALDDAQRDPRTR